MKLHVNKNAKTKCIHCFNVGFNNLRVNRPYLRWSVCSFTHQRQPSQSSSGSSDREEGRGRETWNLCGRLQRPSFLWLIFKGRGHGPLGPPGSATAVTVMSSAIVFLFTNYIFACIVDYSWAFLEVTKWCCLHASMFSMSCQYQFSTCFWQDCDF